jgi:hypothetical protein
MFTRGKSSMKPDLRIDRSVIDAKWFVRGFLAVALVCGIGPSAAGDRGKGWDYKILPGAACQPATPDVAANLIRTPVGLQNNSLQDRQHVLCPIVRDTVNEYDLDAGVAVSHDVSCQFYVMDYRGVYAPGTPHNPIGTIVTNGVFIHYFQVKANPNVDPPGFVGYYNLSCILPAGGAVYSYGLGENADTTDYGE